EDHGRFTADQVEILSAQRDEPEWLRSQRKEAFDAFVGTPMPDTRPEEWRYTRIRDLLDLEALQLATERPPITDDEALPAGLREIITASGETEGRIVQVGGSVVSRQLPEELAAQGVIFT